MPGRLRQRLGLTLTAIALAWPSVSSADESAVREGLRQKYPEIRVDAVAKTPLNAIYEVFADGEIFYVDADVKFLFVKGSMIDVVRRVDLTEERLRVLTAIKFDQLPLDHAFRIVRGNGKRKMAYFPDPNCPYCKRLDQTLATVTDVTVYMFLYPILGPDSQEKAKAIWCSNDRAKVYLDVMLKDAQPKGATRPCQTPMEQILEFGRGKGVNATPTLFFGDGQRVSGAISAEQLNKMLDGGK